MGQEEPPRATIKDVARLAGVSPTTVSHALNNKGIIKKETAERIREAARTLGYRPNSLARGLRQSRIGLISLVIRPLTSLETLLPDGVDYFMRFAGAATLTALHHGYGLMLVGDPSDPRAPMSSLAADACIVADPLENDPVLTLLQRQQIPFLTVGQDPARPGAYPCLDSDIPAGARLVLDHLRESGASRAALITGTDRNAWNIGTRTAYRDWCREHGQEPVELAVPETRGETAGPEILHQLFDSTDGSRIDAVYCLTGRHASGLVAAAVASGIEVPREMLVAAGSEAIQNRTQSPTVTALDLKPEAEAQRAVELVVGMLAGDEISWPQEAPLPELHQRASTTR